VGDFEQWLTDEERERLRLARDAIPGPWHWDSNDACMRLHGSSDMAEGCLQILKAPKKGTPYAEYWPNEWTALHISCNDPQTTIEGLKEIARLRADLEEAREVLREVEWAAGRAVEADDGNLVDYYEDVCPVCRCEAKVGHWDGCRLGTLLKRLAWVLGER